MHRHMWYSATMSERASSRTVRHPLYSIGHGNRSLEEFLNLLRLLRIDCLGDVRSCPASRRNPHFDKESLQPALGEVGISYAWFPDLGGFRRKGLGSKSPHTALKSTGFRNYADYMTTDSFRNAADKLDHLASFGSACFMCAETAPQRCHRFLLADYLCAQGIRITHILDVTCTTEHQLSKEATVIGDLIIYNRGEPQQMELKADD